MTNDNGKETYTGYLSDSGGKYFLRRDQVGSSSPYEFCVWNKEQIAKAGLTKKFEYHHNSGDTVTIALNNEKLPTAIDKVTKGR